MEKQKEATLKSPDTTVEASSNLENKGESNESLPNGLHCYPRALKTDHTTSELNLSTRATSSAARDIGITRMGNSGVTQFLNALDSYFREWKSINAPNVGSGNASDNRNLQPERSIKVPVVLAPAFDSNSFRKFFRSFLSSLQGMSRNTSLAILPNILMSPWDRCVQDFEKICVLGEGSFGTVFKVRHRLDGNEYALKRVQLRFATSDSCEEFLREVRLLSEMRHPNIARYFSSWLQMEEGTTKSGRHHYSNDYRDSSSAISGVSRCVSAPRNFDHECGSSSILFQNSRDVSLDAGISLRPGAASKISLVPVGAESVPNASANIQKSWRTTPHHFSSLVNSGCNLDVKDVENAEARSSNAEGKVVPYIRSWSTPVMAPTLYMQMELGCQSLLSWLQVRNDRARNKTFHWCRSELRRHFNVIKGLLEGIIYMHGKGIVHRDIKPANILLSATDGRVLLADFGLAKFILESDLKSSFLRSVERVPETWVGTPTYCAPEVVEGKVYNAKADIYSLGIVIAELLCPFSSMMERAKTIENLKYRRRFQPGIEDKNGYLTCIILAMTELTQDLRPSASEVIEQLNELTSLNQRYRKNSVKAESLMGERCRLARKSLSVEGQNSKTLALRRSLRRCKTFPTVCSPTFAQRNRSLRYPNRATLLNSVSSAGLALLKRKDEEIRRLKDKVDELEDRIRKLELAHSKRRRS